MFNIVFISFFWQEMWTCMTCQFIFGNISQTPSLLHNVLWICACTRSWSECYGSGTCRPLDKNLLPTPTIFRILRSTHMPWWLAIHCPQLTWRRGMLQAWGPNCVQSCSNLLPRGHCVCRTLVLYIQSCALPPHKPYVECNGPSTRYHAAQGWIYLLSVPVTQAMYDYIQEALSNCLTWPSMSPAFSGFSVFSR